MLPDAARAVLASFADAVSAPQELAALRRPVICGVYLLLRGDSVIYVGQSVDLLARIDGHFDAGRDFDRVVYVECAAHDLDPIEEALIFALRPPHNSIRPPTPDPALRTVRTIDGLASLTCAKGTAGLTLADLAVAMRAERGIGRILGTALRLSEHPAVRWDAARGAFVPLD